ncbi:type II toxin-antitoxin system RelE/ParE family toxin [Rodentibacter myodis]|uniref:Addiction module killer protein n=1 Tax=Rodentibacter myodis TaxID=1907939 RepID=A0A1V3JKY5_9PAST|nr:addiction module killer protein [Rodentibacter myodis]
MHEIIKIEITDTFARWLEKLKDPIAKASIARRIYNAKRGNFGDWKALGDGVNEMRLSVSKGYRIYYAQQGEVIYILLNGGHKGTQQADIEKAKTLWAELKGKGE